MPAIRRAVVAIMILGTISQLSQAQPPVLKDRLRERNSSEKTTRGPYDNLEGTVWQYRATRKDKDGKELVIEGRFRSEERGLYLIDKELPGPDLPRLKKNLTGEKPKVQTNRGTRVGDVTETDGKIKLIFETSEKDFPLNGFMILWPKKDRPGVLMGHYTEKKGDKLGEKWIVEIRECED